MNIDQTEIDNFDKYAHEWWNKRGPYKFIHLLTPLRLEYIQKNTNLKNADILDLGCGGGLLTEQMHKHGANVVGLDASSKTIKIAKKHAKEQNLKIDYVNTNIEEYSNKKKFDVIICFELIEHVPNPSKLIENISKIIKPGGKLFLSTINRNIYSFIFAKIIAEYVLNVIPQGTHSYEKFLKPSEIRKMINKFNFSMDDICGVKYNPVSSNFSFSSFSKINYFITATKNE